MICKSDLETLNFNDILLLPQPSNIKSRSDVNLYAKDNINKNYFT